MKKFLKVFITVLLVLAVIGGTCFFFFNRYKEKYQTSSSISEFLYSSAKTEFDQDMIGMAMVVNSDLTDNRLSLIISTSIKLDEICKVLSSYYVGSNTKITDKNITDQLNRVIGYRSYLTSMMDEYNIKKESSYFNKHTGANDFYAEACSYLIQYAKLVNLINEHLVVSEKSADLKFTMFDVYANVVITSFNEINYATTEDGRTVIKNDSNIKTINNLFTIENSFIQTEIDKFSSVNNKFISHYDSCNKTLFAQNLTDNIASVTTMDQETNEKIATYYFKLIYNL